jgi:hypothetical protein
MRSTHPPNQPTNQPAIKGDLFDEMKRTLGRMPELELVTKVGCLPLSGGRGV